VRKQAAGLIIEKLTQALIGLARNASAATYMQFTMQCLHALHAHAGSCAVDPLCIGMPPVIEHSQLYMLHAMQCVTPSPYKKPAVHALCSEHKPAACSAALQAFMTHELHRKMNTRLGREQELFSGGQICSTNAACSNSIT
jgi:hypothetical protein